MTAFRQHVPPGAPPGMTAVRVRAPARLHLGILDLAGGPARRFGGLGVAVASPAVVVEATPAPEISVDGPNAERALAAARRCARDLGLAAGAHIRVLEAIPSHIGLGSGTKLALAAARALAVLNDRPASPAELARAAGRGARSAVGVWTFAMGGFVVEGGARRQADTPAPLVARHPVPEAWRCVLAIPEARPGLSGAAEEEAFGTLRPSRERLAPISQLVLTSLLPALVEQDLAEFGAALTRMQRLVGEAFAPVQGGAYHPQSGELVEALLGWGAAGAGQSSWGPATYGVVGSEQAARRLSARMREMLGGQGHVLAVPFDNAGARVEVLCGSS
jgi:beta-RFAP synthase